MARSLEEETGYLEDVVTYFFKLFIYSAASGLGGSTQNLHCVMLDLSLGHTGLVRCIWDLSFQTRDRIRIPCLARQSLNPWTTREVLWLSVKAYFCY